METKKCKICGEEYPKTLEYFYKKIDYRDGLDTTCKKCRSKKDRERRERNKAKTKICSRCGVEKPLNEDNFDKLKVVYKSVCKSCREKARKKHLENKRKKKKELERIEKAELEREKFEENTYKRLINEPLDKGIGNKKFDYPFLIGKKYKIVKLGLREGQTKINRTLAGELTQVTNDLFVIKSNKGYCESFLKKDYLIGEIEIREA